MITKCGCNKQQCEGECRKLHLNRKRKTLLRCPAAYEDSVSKKKGNKDD